MQLTQGEIFMVIFEICNPVTGEVYSNVGGTVALPFGTEYGIKYSHYTDGRKVKLNISIDGKDVLEGNSLVIHPNTSGILKSFFSTGNAFKFIQMTDKIRNHRGERSSDGTISIGYRYEKKPRVEQWTKCAKSMGCMDDTRSTGFTTEGGKTDQKFTSVNDFETETKIHRVSIELVGAQNAYTT